MESKEPTITFVSELQLIVNFMDDSILLNDDEDFEKELTTISLEKSYKTRRGLHRHTEICKEKKDPIDKKILAQLLLEAVLKVNQDECCPKEIQEDAMKCNISIDHPLVNAELDAKLFDELCNKKNIDTFYVEYMANIVHKASTWLPSLEEATAVQIAMQFGEKMVHHAQKPSILKVVETKRSMTPKENHCITYIGGYVVRNLRKKLSLKKIDDDVKQQYSTLLDACFQKGTSTKQDCLVSTLTRGGLVEINSTLARLFEVVETYFRTSVSKELEQNKTTNLPGHVLLVTNRMDIKDKFHVLIESCDQLITNEISENFLEDIIHLYFKIRCFSFTKDLLQQMRAKSKITKGKALQTELKKKEVKEKAN
eukprot:gene2322-2674_t